MKSPKKIALLASILLTASVVANAGDVGSSLHKKEEVELADVPKSVISVIQAANPQFKMNEAEKESKHGNTYFDIEGVDGDGNEIEYDMLLNNDGTWSIAEIQRDLTLDQCPKIVVDLYQKQVGIEPARIIESDQGDGTVIYEFYTLEADKEKKYEIKLSASLLEKEWTH